MPDKVNEERSTSYRDWSSVSCVAIPTMANLLATKRPKARPVTMRITALIGTDAYRFSGQRICSNAQVRTDLLEVAVWREVRALLEHPQRLEQEYHRREQEPNNAKQQNLASLESQISKLRRGMGRLIDSYAEGLIDKGEFEPRITRLKERMAALEAQAKQVSQEMALNTELRLIISRLEDFGVRVKDSLEQVDWATQREIIRTLVKQVEIEQEQVNVVFRVGPSPSTPDPGPSTPDLGKDSLQHCKRRDQPPLG